MKILNHLLMALFLFVGFTLLTGQRPVFALTIFEYYFTGTITKTVSSESNDPLPDLRVGDTFIGHLAYQYDPTLEDQVPSNDHRAIYDSYGTYSIKFDNFSITSGSYSYLPIDLTLSSLIFYDFTPLTSDFWSDDLYFRFVSTTGPVFNSYALPYGIDFDAFDEMIIWFDLMGPSLSRPLFGKDVTARIDSIVQVAVPEPGTGLLLLSGLGIGFLAYPKNSKLIDIMLKRRGFI